VLAELASVTRDAIGASDAETVAAIARGLGGATRCGIECAYLDARARSRGEPIFPHDGATLVTDVTIPIGPRDECARDAAAWVARGFTRLKVKIGGPAGGGARDEAIARVVAVHEA